MVEQHPILDPAVTDYYDRAPEESRLELGAFRLEEFRSRELIRAKAAKVNSLPCDPR